jgi:hypothetical protein
MPVTLAHPAAVDLRPPEPEPPEHPPYLLPAARKVALDFLNQGADRKTAAARALVSTRTLRNWLQDEPFQSALQSHREERFLQLVDDSLDRFDAHLNTLLAGLGRNVPPAGRLRSARAILSHTVSLSERLELPYLRRQVQAALAREDAAELAAAEPGDEPHPLAALSEARFRAAAMLAAGETVGEAARIAGVTSRAVRKWSAEGRMRLLFHDERAGCIAYRLARAGAALSHAQRALGEIVNDPEATISHVARAMEIETAWYARALRVEAQLRLLRAVLNPPSDGKSNPETAERNGKDEPGDYFPRGTIADLILAGPPGENNPKPAEQNGKPPAERAPHEFHASGPASAPAQQPLPCSIHHLPSSAEQNGNGPLASLTNDAHSVRTVLRP